MKKYNIYCVRFTTLKFEHIVLECSVCDFNTEHAVDFARYLISNSIEIHPDRLVLSSVTIEE